MAKPFQANSGSLACSSVNASPMIGNASSSPNSRIRATLKPQPISRGMRIHSFCFLLIIGVLWSRPSNFKSGTIAPRFWTRD